VTRRRIVWLSVLVALAALVALGVAAAAMLPEVVRRAAVWRLESLTQRRVTIDRVDLDLLGGRVAVHGLQIDDRDEPAPLARADRITGHVHRRSLLELHVWIDDVVVGDTTLVDGTTTDGIRSMTEVSPVPVDSWTVQVVAFGEGSWVGALELTRAEDDTWNGSLSPEQLAAIQETGATTVAALVTANDPTESARAYPRYTLTADGAVMPGGGQVSAE